jgi:hypothetical protein
MRGRQCHLSRRRNAFFFAYSILVTAMVVVLVSAAILDSE